jgi:hypothetical protein
MAPWICEPLDSTQSNDWVISYQWKENIFKEAVDTWFYSLFLQVCVCVCVCVCVYVQGLKKPMKKIQFSEQASRLRLKSGFPNIKHKYYEFSFGVGIKNLRKYKAVFLIFRRVEKQN